jgi:hypothetical protein
MAQDNPYMLELKANALVAAMLNGEQGWALIEEILSRGYTEISPAEYMALALFLEQVTCTDSLTRIFRLLTTPVPFRYGEVDGPDFIRKLDTDIIRGIEGMMVANFLVKFHFRRESRRAGPFHADYYDSRLVGSNPYYKAVNL